MLDQGRWAMSCKGTKDQVKIDVLSHEVTSYYSWKLTVLFTLCRDDKGHVVEFFELHLPLPAYIVADGDRKVLGKSISTIKLIHE